MLKYTHPWLAVVLDYWPVAILLPSVLVLVAVLALVTRLWDRSDAAAASGRSRRTASPVSSAGG